VEEAALTPARLATAIEAAQLRGRVAGGAAGLDLRGAQTTVDILRERLDIVAS
jgi:predicted glycosyltransferase